MTYFLDLRWLVFGLLVGLCVAATAGYWLGWRTGRGAVTQTLVPRRGETNSSLEHAPFGLLIVEGSGICRYANFRARELLGLSSPICVLPDSPWVHSLKEDCAMARGDAPSAGRYRNISLFPELSDTPAQRERSGMFVRWWVTSFGHGHLVLLLDFTEQHQLEESTHQLINDLSHELRTPLATILTHLEVLGVSSISDEIAQQSVRLLKDEAHRMARLVHRMLELGRLETGPEIETRPVDLLYVVEGVMAQMAPTAEEHHIILSLEADSPLPPALGDEDRLRQLFLDLLDNAVKYCRPGDQVTISVSGEDRGIRCAVRDSGPGIPAEHLSHVVRRFYREGPSETEGNGLGLALAQEILRRHGSSLEIESRNEGERTGTAVQFSLPTSQLQRS